MRNILSIALLLLTVLIVSCSNVNKQDWTLANVILENIKEPVFAELEYLITDYGAISNGSTDCTSAFKDAMEDCALKGGGKIIVPKGIYLTGAIHFKSNVNLYLEKGATLLFSKDYTKYLPVVKTRFEGNDLMNYSPFIYGYNLENIALTGMGTLNGNADNDTWWPWKGQEKYGWKQGDPNQLEARGRLLQMSEQKTAIEDRVFGEGHYLRPNFIQFIECKNILIEDITITNSPMWEIHPILSENIIIRKVSIKSHGPNNDGFDPESCKNILVEGCYFDTGDDCIAIKSGREEDGRHHNIPSENIIIRDCIMKDGHGGVVIGSEISGGCRNVFVENCTMDSPNLDRALRIKTNSLRGGIIENIYMRNCKIGEVKQAILLVNFYYEQGDVGIYTPIVRNIFLDNISSEKSNYAIFLNGYERSPIDNIQIANCNFNGVKKNVFIENAQNISFNNVLINNNIFTPK